jgi:hypothetical protein
MKLKGVKSYREGKCVAEEVLPNRFAKATITGGDLYQRMGNFYGKKVEQGAQSGPSPLIMITNSTRGFM